MRQIGIIGIIVSKDYDNMIKIKDCINNIKSNSKNSIEICVMSNTPMKSEIKKFVLNINSKYSEVLRYDEPFNIHSVDLNHYKFNKKYNSKYYYMMENLFLWYCDGFYVFNKNSNKKNNDYIYSIFKKINRSDKKVKIIN